jgi:hypothetical protein
MAHLSRRATNLWRAAMVSCHEPTPAAVRASPPHRINSLSFIYELTCEIRTRAYPFIDLIWTVDPVTDFHHLMRFRWTLGSATMDPVYGLWTYSTLFQ